MPRVRFFALLLGAIAGCAEPPAPTYLPRDELKSPPVDSAQKCVPPYPSDFGNAVFAYADLDIGKSCTLYVEQDECVVAIYRDCAVTGATEREWQGEADNETGTKRTVTLRPILVGTGNMPLRTPVCCEGQIQGETGGLYNARLSCGIGRQCPVEDPVPEHVGMLLQELDPSIQPENRIDPTRLSINPVHGADVTALVTVPNSEELYLVVDASGISAADGLYRVNVGSNGAAPVIPATSANALLSAVGPGVVYFADGPRLFRLTPPSTVTGPMNQIENITALAYTRAGLLIATSAGIDNGTLRLLDPTTLAETASSPRPAPIVGLAGTADPIAATTAIAVAISSNTSAIEHVGPSLAAVGSHVPKEDQGELLRPEHLIHVRDDIFGWIAPCYQPTSSRKCYWQYVYGEHASRTSTPDVEGITGITVSKDGKSISLASSTGPISIVEDDPVLLKLQQRVEIHEPTGPLATASDGQIWVLLPSSNQLARLLPLND